jgi:hypothetical protein
MQPKNVWAGNDNTPMVHVMSMPERARAIATRCGSKQVAELLELHARLCEQNLAASVGTKHRKGGKPIAVI